MYIINSDDNNNNNNNQNNNSNDNKNAVLTKKQHVHVLKIVVRLDISGG